MWQAISYDFMMLPLILQHIFIDVQVLFSLSGFHEFIEANCLVLQSDYRVLPLPSAYKNAFIQQV